MSLPRWTVYPALVVIATLLVIALPERNGEDPYSGAARGAIESPATPEAADPSRKTRFPKVMVLGIDGMDPDILKDVIEEVPELMPNFRWLIAQADGIQVLGTSCPPQSPVAWSNFITGMDPGGHGLYDFIHRDYVTRGPAGSTAITEEGSNIWLPGKWRLPIPGQTNTNRSGDAFWKILRKEGVPADIWRMPVNFPVVPSHGVSFCGMMTPALDSAYGQCSFFTSNSDRWVEVDYSKATLVNVRRGKVESRIMEPQNPFLDPVKVSKDSERTKAVVEAAAFTAYLDTEANAAAIHIEGGETVILQPGEWSDFVRVEFSLLPAGMTTLSGIVRFYLRSIEPEFELYVSPVNFDPENPVEPVSQPKGASADLVESIGRYYTQGMAEDVNALKKGVLTDAEFMQQAHLVYLERTRMLDYALDRYMEDDDGGLLFFYYSTCDLICHMMWRHTDPAHPDHKTELAAQDSSFWSGRPGSTWKDLLKDLYVKFDPILGIIRERLGDDTTLIVMSDHGFASYRRKFNLNTWLVEEGYLVLNPLEDGTPREITEEDEIAIDDAGIVDWSKTQAYGMGFNSLYLNLAGREKDNLATDDVDESGIVQPGADADALLLELKQKLEALVDEETGLRPVVRCDLASEVYHGDRVDEAPDIVVGYNAGYGNSDEASLGGILCNILDDNVGGTFNGHHLMAPDVVHGVLISNRPVRDGFHELQDVTVEVLAQYGIEKSETMDGHRVLE